MRNALCIFAAFVALAGAMAAGPALAAGDATGFRDDFSTCPAGSSGAPRWNVLRGQWAVRDGALAQTADGEGFAIAADAGASGSYRLEARFRTVAGIPGEGVLFGLRDARHGGACHVVRVDPEGLYYGSVDAAGEFRGDGPVPALVEATRWNVLLVTVNAATGTYAIDFNGERAADGLALEFTGPAIGLVSNWGEQEFSLVAVTPIQDAAGAAGAARPPARPVDLAATRGGQVLLLERGSPPIRVLGPDLATVAAFGRLLPGDRPVAIEVGPAGEAYVLDEDSGRIDRYPAEGGPPGGDVAKIEPTAEPRAIAATPPLKGARGLAVMSDGRLVVAEAAASRVAILSPAGERLGEVGRAGGGPGEHERPSDVAVDSRGRLIVADFRGCRVQAFRPDGSGGYVLDARSPWMAPPGRLAVAAGDRIAVLGRFAYYETGGAIRLLEPNLLPRGYAGCFAAGNITEDGGIAAVPGGGLLVVSLRDAMLFRFPGDMVGQLDVRPIVSYDGARALIAWQPIGAANAQPQLQFRREGERAWKSAAVRSENTGFVATIEGLDRDTPHEYRFMPHYDARSLGPARIGPWSKPYRFYGPEPAGSRRCLDLSVICAVYLSFRDASTGNVFTLEREKLGHKIEREFEVARAFYARNTALRLNVHADFETIAADTPALVKNGWIDPSQARRDLAPLLAARGKKVDQYDSIIAVWAEPGWQPDVPDDPGTVGGGGLTSFGYSSFGIGGRFAWLVGHEYHHQIDAFFNRSGHLDYPLNHPDATVEPGRYGQHWDCNAFFLRWWRDQDWFLSRFGTVLWTTDADGDGVPDKDPRLAFDEARLGSDPAKRDTDGDGLDDLAELMTGTFRGADPGNPDTDGDGTRDGDDALPLNRAFSKAAVLRRGTPILDGKAGDGEWQEIGALVEPGATIFGRWDADRLFFAVKAARPVRVAFEVDGANDGWFLEDDNAAAEIEVNGAATPPVHGAPGASTAGSAGPFAELSVPASWVRALQLVPGSRFGLCVRVTWREGEGEGTRHRELFMSEPWELLELELGK